MPQPSQLIRGKKFQVLVQKDFIENTKDGTARKEAFISFKDLKQVRKKYGRMDIFIDELDADFVTIVEVKATDWDKIKPSNIKKNLWRHQRQLFHYIEKYLDVDKLQVCPGIIYPKPPKSPSLRQFIETCLEEYGAPAYWYSEIKTD